MKREPIAVLSALLAVLILIPVFSACSGSVSPEEKTPDSVENSVQTASAAAGETYARKDTPDTLPAGLDFGGQSIVLYYRDFDILHKYQMQGENNGGDILYDAVYNRNRAVSERLNAVIEFKTGPANDSWSDLIRNAVQTDIMAGEADWDLLFMSAQFGFTQSLLGYYIDLMNFPYIDVGQPWWWVSYMEEESIDTTKRFMLNGDITLFALMSATSAYFNKNMFTDIYGDPEALYTAAENGAWTVEKFLGYCAGAYSDLNGDGLRGEEDIYGARHTSIWTGVNYLTLSCGLPMSGRDENGLPVLDIYNENWIKWTEILQKYIMSDEYSRISAGAKTTEQYFTGQGSLFSMGMLFNADEFRDTEFAYGIVPFPKFDEAHDYLSAGATPNADAVFVPVTTAADKYELIGAVTEALCAESYRSVTEIYYEKTLKGKYLENERDIKMVDIIYQNIGTCFVMVAGVELGAGAVSSMFVYVLQDSDGNLTSYYEKNKTAFEQYMADMLEKYRESGQP